ncbi:MAG: hypothetical protein ACK58T_38515 [Phycisphaerae bacterium]|jgi:hypothetical protein
MSHSGNGNHGSGHGGGHADAWHHHESAEGMPQSEHAATVDPMATLKVLVFVMGFTAIFILVTILYFNTTVRQQREAKIETIGAAESYNAMKGQMERDLSTYGVADAASKTVRVPVEKAIDRVVKKYATK